MKAYKRSRLITLLLLLSIVVFAPGCSKRPPEPRLAKINIAFQEWVGHGLFYLAQDKGFCREEGIELVFVNEQLDSARRDAFKVGMLDCEAGTLDLLVSKASQDTPITAVLEIDYSFGGDGIVAAENVRTLEDLAGKKVALARDDVGETLISFLFQKKGLSLDGITVVPTLPEGAAQAFLDGEADACVTWEPWLTKALTRPDAHLLTSSRENPGLIIDTLNVRQDLVRNDPLLVKKLMRAWFRALTFYREHPVEASEIIARYYNLTGPEYRKQAEGLRWVAYEEQRDPSRYKEWREDFGAIAEIKLRNGRITKKPDAQKHIDHTLLEKLYEDSK